MYCSVSHPGEEGSKLKVRSRFRQARRETLRVDAFDDNKRSRLQPTSFGIGASAVAVLERLAGVGILREDGALSYICERRFADCALLLLCEVRPPTWLPPMVPRCCMPPA